LSVLSDFTSRILPGLRTYSVCPILPRLRTRQILPGLKTELRVSDFEV
jgi:hypothetical protein